MVNVQNLLDGQIRWNLLGGQIRFGIQKNLSTTESVIKQILRTDSISKLRLGLITLGQQYNVGEKPTVILYTYINRHAGEVLYFQLLIPPKRFDIFPDWGMLRRSRCIQIFL